MITNYISIDTLLEDWIEDNPLSQEAVSKTQLKRWATDTAKDFSTVDTLEHRIAVLQLKNTKAELPKDFHSIISIGYRVLEDKNDCITTQKVCEYTQKLHNGCEYKITVKCDKCKKNTCECGEGIIKVDVNRIWELENPWYYDVSKFAVPGDSDMLNAAGKAQGNRFKLMSYNVNPFHNINSHVPNCINLNCSYCEHKYTVTPPFIETDIVTRKNVEILLAYVGKRVDNRGDLLVPDATDFIEAINYQLDYQFYRRMYKATGERVYKDTYSESYIKRDLAIGRAKTSSAIPDKDKLIAELNEVFKPKKTVY